MRRRLLRGALVGLLLAGLVFACHSVLRPRRRIVEGIAATTLANYNGFRVTRAALEQGAWPLTCYTTVLFNHDDDRPIGKLLDYRVVGDELRVTIEIDRDEIWLWGKIRSGSLTGISYRARPIRIKDYDYHEGFDTTISVTGKMLMLEVSIVTIPAGPRARIASWRVE